MEEIPRLGLYSFLTENRELYYSRNFTTKKTRKQTLTLKEFGKYSTTPPNIFIEIHPITGSLNENTNEIWREIIMDKYDYDIDVDAFVLRKSEYNYAYSIDITSEIIIDVDDNKNLIGIEFLDASKVLNVNPELLIHPKKIIAEIKSINEGINLTMKFEFDNLIREINTPISTIFNNNEALIVY